MIESRWIDVRDRLPEDGRTVYALWEEGTTSLASFYASPGRRGEGRRWWDDSGCNDTTVIAWMPLPLPEDFQPRGIEAKAIGS